MKYETEISRLADLKPLPDPHYLVGLTHNQLSEQKVPELTLEQLRVLGGLSLRTTDDHEDFAYAQAFGAPIALREVIPGGWLESRSYITSLTDRLFCCLEKIGGVNVPPPAMIWFDQEHTRQTDANSKRMMDVCMAMYYACKAVFPGVPVMWYKFPSVTWRWNGTVDSGTYPTNIPTDRLSCDLYYRDDHRNKYTLGHTLNFEIEIEKYCTPFVAIDGAYDIVYGSTPGQPSQVIYRETAPTLDRLTEKAQLGWILGASRRGKPGNAAWPDMARVTAYHAIGPMPETNEYAKGYDPRRIGWYVEYLRAYVRGAHDLPLDWRPGPEV